MKNIGAFFDIDGTLYRESLIGEIFKKLITAEIIDKTLWYNEVKDRYKKWSNRTGNYDDYLLKMAEIYIDAIKGFHKTHIEFIAKNVINQKGDKVYTYTRDRIKWHLNEGHKVIAISGSPIQLVSEMAKKHNFTDYIGTIYSTNNDVFTGETKPMWDSQHKQIALSSFAKKYNIDLSKSFSYGDTSGDFSILKNVGYPTAINPTKELLTKIIHDEEITHKVKIIVERKDMIYKLTPDCIGID